MRVTEISLNAGDPFARTRKSATVTDLVVYIASEPANLSVRKVPDTTTDRFRFGDTMEPVRAANQGDNLMTVDTKKFGDRADMLLERAKAMGLNSIDQELSLLPKKDPVAQIGYLANAMGIDVGLAFDVDAPIEEDED